MTGHDHYATGGRELLAKAFEELAQGDLRQASEKGWGAAAQLVKAVVDQRGWQHNGHGYLFQVVRQLAEEARDPEISTLFHFASSLHTNLYEDWLPREMVESGLSNVTQFIERLERLLR